MKKIPLFAFILILLLIISLSFYFATGSSSSITLTGFLNFLSTEMGSIDISWSFVDLTIYGDWGIFEFLRNFLNIFADAFEVLIMFVGMVYRALMFSIRFVRGLLFP